MAAFFRFIFNGDANFGITSGHVPRLSPGNSALGPRSLECSQSSRDSGGMPWLAGAMAFAIHPRLAAGGFEIGSIGGCRLLLKDNSLFPWFLLVPEVEGIEDLHELPPAKFEQTMAAMRRVSEFVSDHFQPEKLNVASIGNQVRQMHIHIVGRSTADPAWPGTVWAHDGKAPYEKEERDDIIEAARSFFDL